jgi:hypothetical protein
VYGHGEDKRFSRRHRQAQGGARAPTLRILLRRSEKEGQDFSIDTQREGALRFAQGLRHREPPILWEGTKDCIDDGIAGDDFDGRAALHQLLADVAPRDLIVCRDHFRLGSFELVNPVVPVAVVAPRRRMAV